MMGLKVSCRQAVGETAYEQRRVDLATFRAVTARTLGDTVPKCYVQGGSGTELEPETGTVRTVFSETESGTGTAGTVFQEPKPEPSFLVKLY